MAASPPQPDSVLRGHRKDVTALRFAAGSDGHGHPVLLSGAADGELLVWSLYTHRSIASRAVHPGHSLLGIHALGDSHALTHGRDGFVRTWDLRDGVSGPLLECCVASPSFCSAVPAPAPLSAQPLIAMPSPDAAGVVLWDARQPRAARQLAPVATRERAGMCMSLSFVGTDMLASGWEDGTLQLFHLRGASPPEVRQLHSEPLLCIDLDPRARALVTGSADCQLCTLPLVRRSSDVAQLTSRDGDGAGSHPESGLGQPAKVEIPVTNEASGCGGIASVRVRADGKICASGGWDRRVRLWQWRNMKPLAVLRHHTATVNAVDFSPCSRWLASGSGDGTIALWRGLYC